jgi:hypothetical protein
MDHLWCLRLKNKLIFYRTFSCHLIDEKNLCRYNYLLSLFCVRRAIDVRFVVLVGSI